MGTELPTKVMLGQTLVLMQMTFLNNVRHVKELYEHDRCSSAKFSCHVSHPRFTCSATRWCLLALLTDVPGGRIRLLEPG
jgi:hypothetical protein